MSCRQILDALQRDYRQAKLVRHGATFSVLAVGGGLSGGSVFLGAPVEMAVGAAAMTLLSAGGLQVNQTGRAFATIPRMRCETPPNCVSCDLRHALTFCRRERKECVDPGSDR